MKVKDSNFSKKENQPPYLFLSSSTDLSFNPDLSMWLNNTCATEKRKRIHFNLHFLKTKWDKITESNLIYQIKLLIF